MNELKIEKLDDNKLTVLDCPILGAVGIRFEEPIITVTCRSLADDPLFQNIHLNKDIYSKDREMAAAGVASRLIMTGISNMIATGTPRKEKSELIKQKYAELDADAVEKVLALALIKAIHWG